MKDLWKNWKILWGLIVALIGYNYWLHEDVSSLKTKVKETEHQINIINDSYLLNQRKAIWDIQDSVHSISMRIDLLLKQ